MGHLARVGDGENPYRLPPFFELHSWAWRDNPAGPLEDWNRNVSC